MELKTEGPACFKRETVIEFSKLKVWLTTQRGGGGHTSPHLKDPHLKRQNDVIATFEPAAGAEIFCFLDAKMLKSPL